MRRIVFKRYSLNFIVVDLNKYPDIKKNNGILMGPEIVVKRSKPLAACPYTTKDIANALIASIQSSLDVDKLSLFETIFDKDGQGTGT